MLTSRAEPIYYRIRSKASPAPYSCLHHFTQIHATAPAIMPKAHHHLPHGHGWHASALPRHHLSLGPKRGPGSTVGDHVCGRNQRDHGHCDHPVVKTMVKTSTKDLVVLHV